MSDLDNQARKIRKAILKLALKYNLPHIAPAFSTVEILVALYEEVLDKNDKFILSKGHGSLGLYAVLRQKGLNPTISGHPDIECAQGIECTTGSLGHGLPIAAGIALARKLKAKQGNIYVLISDGECNEGTIRESTLIAAHHKLDNLTIIVDHNKLQALGRVEEILSLESLSKKFAAFNCRIQEVDGHCVTDIISALQDKSRGQPRVIVAHTIKGKGLSFMENDPKWHNRLPNPEELKIAEQELA